MDKLGGVFLFGVAFAVMIAGMGTGAWLLVKLVSALGRLRLSPEERERQAAAARHPFAKVSLRGKAAWLICCLEQALLAWGLDAEEGEPGSWHPVLALLWKLPELPEECLEDWLGQAGDILPQGQNHRRRVYRPGQRTRSRFITAADEGVTLRDRFLFILPKIHCYAPSGLSRVNRPSLLPRYSSSRTRAMRPVSTSPPRTRKPLRRPACSRRA